MADQRVIHDTAMQMVRNVMALIKDDIPYGRRLSVLYAIYYNFKSGIESYESLAERRHGGLLEPYAKPSNN